MATTARVRGRTGGEGARPTPATAWALRLVREGDRYGPAGLLRHSGPEAFVELHPAHTLGLRRCARRPVDDLYVAPLARPLVLDARERWALAPGQLITLLEWLDRADARTAHLGEDGDLRARRLADARRGLRRPLARPPGGFRRWDEPASPAALERLIGHLVVAGPAAHAGDPEGEAVFWMEARFAPDEVAGWLAAGVDDLGTAVVLRAAGLPAPEAARRPRPGTVAPGGHRFDGESIADAVRAGTLTAAEALALRPPRPSQSQGFPAGCWT